MASLVNATTSNLAEQLQLLETESAAALTQQQAAEKAMASFAKYFKQHPTSENATTYQALVTEATEANLLTASLRRQANAAQLALLKDHSPSASQNNASLADNEVVELDLSGPVGYFPT